jgi:RNA polymerase sigma-70 factor, ECF subfamily
MDRTEETQLVKSIIDGDAKAFSVVVKHYQHPVHSLIKQIVWCREDAEDLTQEVFIKAFVKLSSFRGSSSLSTWLHRIAYNTAISAVRKKKLNYVECDEMVLANLPEADVDEALNREDDERLLHKMEEAIEKLEPEERALLSLYYKQGLPVMEVASIAGLSPENVKVKLYRIRKKIYYLIDCYEAG